MNIVLAPDSYKGSLSAVEVAQVIKDAIYACHPHFKVQLKPMADGGEGTLAALQLAKDGEEISFQCQGPLGEPIKASYVVIDRKTAIIEAAKMIGLPQVPTNERNPDHTTSFGLGEAIFHALDQGCTYLIIGLGGSATNDGGLGMLLALGMKAYDQKGREIGPYGKDLLRLHQIDLTPLDERLKEVTIKVACDVDNPLSGEQGASYVYGPQKGMTQEQIPQYDEALKRFGSLAGKTLKDVPGSGAAGGLGFALLLIGATLESGASLVAEAIQLETAIQKADLVITGEGQTDEQTLYGKAPGYIASLAKKYNVPTLLISGSLQGDLSLLRQTFSGCFSIHHGPTSKEQSIKQAKSLLYEQTKNIFHFLYNFKH